MERFFCRALRGALAALLLLTVLPAVPAARAVEIDPTGMGAGFASVLYDNSNGLPTSEANAIIQSADGFLWIGSYSGLIRYDGNTFYRYDASSGVSSVVCLFSDSAGRIWVGTNDSGAACLHDEEFTFYDRSSGLTSASIRAITEDDGGNILIATTMGLACVDGQGQLRRIQDDMVDRQYVCELDPGPGGVVYGVTLSGDVFTVENCRITAYYGGSELGMDKVNCMFPDPARPGWAYLGSEESDVLYGDLNAGMAGARRLSAAPMRNINAIRLVNGSVWVCADNGIGFFLDDGTFVPLQDVPMTNSVDHMLEDHEENLWFSSSRQGVMKIVPCRFTDVSAMADLDPMVVNTTCRSGDELYVGTDSGLVILDGQHRPVQNALTERLTGVRIRCIRSDRRGRLWLCTYNTAHGLVCYDPATGAVKNYTTANGLAADRARMICELSDGTVAVATNAGMNLIRDDEVVALYNGEQGISNLEILCIEEGPDGRIYLGSDGGGIYVVEGSRVSRLGVEDGLRSEVILRIKKDAKEDLYWIITSNSISYLRGGKITTLRDFPYSNNFDLYFDESDRAWILSSDGIYVAAREDLLADNLSEYTHYDGKSGLSRVATANSYSQLDPDGTLYVACSTGVVSLNINGGDAGSSNVRLAVPWLTADEERIPVRGDTVHIPARCRRLSVYANAFTYAMYNPHLTYYLEGFDSQPMDTTKLDMPAISYTNLAGGTYRFHLSLLDALTGAEQDALVLTIVKDRALHEQPWFRIAAAVAVAGLAALAVWIVFRRKTAALVRKQKETRQLVNEMTHVFAECVDMKDPYTNGHSARVAKYTAMIARKLGKSEEEVADIYNIALLHDIGKISIPDSILNKPSRLTDEEFAIMRSHSERGYEILKEVQIAPQLAVGAGYHHERVDGKGYPRGLTGDEIPEVAQIIAVADTFDAMYSTRPYRKQLPLATVAAEIQRIAGTQLNPRVVAAFMELVEEGEIDKVQPPAPQESEPPAEAQEKKEEKKDE